MLPARPGEAAASPSGRENWLWSQTWLSAAAELGWDVAPTDPRGWGAPLAGRDQGLSGARGAPGRDCHPDLSHFKAVTTPGPLRPGWETGQTGGQGGRSLGL